MRRRNGFTFVELLLVIFVLVAAAAGIVGSYLSSHYLSQYGRETMIANDDLRDMMERINATPFSALQTNFPSGTVNGPGGNPYERIVDSVVNGVFPLPGEQITVTYPSQSATRLEVLVTVTWTHRGGQRTASIVGLRTNS